MRLGSVTNWFTGNIGYHHVHHLNPSIPFYRLPEAMAAVPELRNPRETSLHPHEIVRCFQLDLWNPVRQRMVRFDEVSEQTESHAEAA
jgi:omega-6 fatty acid desaturase (delta-12 desaturase)